MATGMRIDARTGHQDLLPNHLIIPVSFSPPSPQQPNGHHINNNNNHDKKDIRRRNRRPETTPSSSCMRSGPDVQSLVTQKSVNFDPNLLVKSDPRLAFIDDEEDVDEGDLQQQPSPPTKGRQDMDMTSCCCCGCCCFGVSDSLYESYETANQEEPHRRAGDPIADSFSVLVTPAFRLVVLGDGVNWGSGAAAAASRAVAAATDHLSHSLSTLSRIPDSTTTTTTTRDVCVCLLRAFSAAQESILADDEATITTLTVAVVVRSSTDINGFIVMTCTVGDSFAFIYSPPHDDDGSKTGRVREVTTAAHNNRRDMRDALGALGPVTQDRRPGLANLSIGVTTATPGDVLFVTSDGISDNFDPVVGRLVRQSRIKNTDAPADTIDHRPQVTGQERQELMLARMAHVIDCSSRSSSSSAAKCHRCPTVTRRRRETRADSVCRSLVSFAVQVTQEKRDILSRVPCVSPTERQEEGKKKNLLAEDEDRSRRRKVAGLLSRAPGKLDHATVAAVVIR